MNRKAAGIGLGNGIAAGSERATSETRLDVPTRAPVAEKPGVNGGRFVPVLLFSGGILAMAAGWSGYAVTRSLAGTDSLRNSELDRRILSEARELSAAASNRLSLAAAWAQAEQLAVAAASSSPSTASNDEQGRSGVRPPVAQWHVGSTVVREQTLSGPGLLLSRLGRSAWVASRLSDGTLQLVSRLGSASADSAEAELLVSRWKEGLLGDALASMDRRSDAGSIRARLWLNAEESLGNGSAAVDRGLLKSVFSGEKLRGFGALQVDSREVSRRMAFDRALDGALVATVDAEVPAPALAWGRVTASASPHFAALALLGSVLAGAGALLALNRAPRKRRAEPVSRALVSTEEPVVAEVKSRAAPVPPPSSLMGLGAESAGAPVFVSGGGAPASASVETSTVEEDSEEVRELRLRVASLEREIESARRMIRVMQDEDRVVFEFERDAVSGRDPRKLGDRLAKSASKLCGSAALYLQFQAPLEVLSLVAESGIDPSLVPSQLHVPIDAAACERISQLAQEGSIPSLAGYEPLAQAVLRQFGASHFDAWAVTGYSWLGRAAGKPRLIGVLVLLQPGSETLTRVRSLGRMVRNVGLLFENTLLSQH